MSLNSLTLFFLTSRYPRGKVATSPNSKLDSRCPNVKGESRGFPTPMRVNLRALWPSAGFFFFAKCEGVPSIFPSITFFIHPYTYIYAHSSLSPHNSALLNFFLCPLVLLLFIILRQVSLSLYIWLSQNR